VVDSADRQRIDLCVEELNALLPEDELRGVPLVIMANKQDLPEAMKTDELSQRLGLSNIKDRTWTIIPTSALKGEGIKEAFTWLSETMEARGK
jgi:signal recognition particle receptor subunit beta